ncbi:hypothetical protein CcCBS67573_g02177 [Chytriomyces confervae]|uniref:adenylate cyclase n=1 Tax=Chytriomyces confervae TaxID=246404 RepID=A0A507FJG7_9FUNG|nr:hypothetical protein CcCBS67573_g02177 [Chytriomyces confervae]
MPRDTDFEDVDIITDEPTSVDRGQRHLPPLRVANDTLDEITSQVQNPPDDTLRRIEQSAAGVGGADVEDAAQLARQESSNNETPNSHTITVNTLQINTYNRQAETSSPAKGHLSPTQNDRSPVALGWGLLSPFTVNPPATTPISPPQPPKYLENIVEQSETGVFDYVYAKLSNGIFSTAPIPNVTLIKDKKVSPSTVTENSSSTLNVTNVVKEYARREIESPERTTENDFLVDGEHNSANEYMQKNLHFKSRKLEKEYLFEVLLPTRVVFLRLGSAILGIYTVGYLIWFLASFGTNGAAWQYGLLVGITLLCAAHCVFTSWKKGRLYISCYVENEFARMGLFALEIITVAAAVGYDFMDSINPSAAMGSVANTAIGCVFLTAGLSSTFAERLTMFAFIIIVVIAKASLIAEAYGIIQTTIYLLPIAMTCLLMFDSVYVGDRDRRTKMINTKIVHARLKGLEESSEKTEYLLSLTLPATIVTKLKDVGTGNFDLIAERFEMTSVMFADIKNFKDIAHSISTKSAITLLNTIFHHMDDIRGNFVTLERIKTINSKLLIVGGLSKSDSSNDLLELIDMALVYKEIFETAVQFEEKSLKLQIGMGIHIGPLVAGIVGKKTFCYEVYGDVVNTASRMLGIAGSGQIVVTSQVWDLVSKDYSGSLIGAKHVKGKGLMNVYSIDARLDSPQTQQEHKKERKKTKKNRDPMQASSGRDNNPVLVIRRDRVINTRILSSAYSAAATAASASTKDDSSVSEEAKTSTLGDQFLTDRGTSSLETLTQSRNGGTDPVGANSASTLGFGMDSMLSIADNARDRSKSKAVAFAINIEAGNDEGVKEIEVNRSTESSAKSSLLNVAPTGANRRWSVLGFSRLPSIQKRSSSKLSFSSLRRSPNSQTVSEEALDFVPEMSQLIKRMSTLNEKKKQKGRRISVDPSWQDQESALSMEELSTTVAKADAKRSADAGLNESRPDGSDFELQSQMLRRQSLLDENVPAKLKYVLILTALAYVGGYKESLTAEEHEILDCTGTLKFLTDASCMDAMHHSMNPFCRFISNDLENRYMFDRNSQLSDGIWGSSVKGIICQLVIITMAIMNLYLVRSSTLQEAGVAIPVIVVCFLATGGQVLIAAVLSAPVQSDLSVSSRLVVGMVSTMALFAVVLLASADWSGLYEYSLLLPLVLPQFTMIHAFTLEGVSYANKLFIVLFFNLVFLITNRESRLSFAPLLLMIPYMLIFHIKETTVKSDYLMGLVAVTQANLVKDEANKSAMVLTTILPKRIITKLLLDPSSMFYEEFSLVTVLHMDIAGFTAMSAQLEPLDVVKIFNNLFSYFDRLISDFRIEKITTIGDAYVACSNLSSAADPRTSAICVCLVALQMQAFVIDQVNETYLMKHKHKQTIAMRIGINTGPCHGAIMGGDKNFRYDLMGETVINAEKIQEHCEIAKVFISESTYNLVKDYHAFKIELSKDCEVGEQPVYVLMTTYL